MNARSPRLWALRTAFRAVGTVAPGVAARWAETIFCTPPRHEIRASEEEFIAAGRRFAVRWEREELAVWEWGRGPTVVLVHGWGSRAGRLTALAKALVDAHAKEMAQAWPEARLVTTAGLGHRTILRDPSVTRATVEFLREGAGA